jgi:hypothetical protein
MILLPCSPRAIKCWCGEDPRNVPGLLILNRHGHELHFKLFRNRTLGDEEVGSQPLETEMRKESFVFQREGEKKCNANLRL